MAGSPTASASAAEGTDGPVLSVVSMRLRALRKKYNRILQMEESFAAGKTLNREQEEVLRSKPVVSALIDELERLRAPLSSALAEELSSRPATPARDASSSSSDSDSSIQDINGSGRDLNGAPPCGQVRVLVVGDSEISGLLPNFVQKGFTWSILPQSDPIQETHSSQ